MLLPKYSIRMLLMVTVVVAFFALLLTYGIRGNTWTIGVAVAIGTLVFVVLVHAALYIFISAVASLKFLRQSSNSPTSANVPRAPLPEAPH